MAAARNVSPAASITLLPSRRKRAASLPIVVVLPVPMPPESFDEVLPRPCLRRVKKPPDLAGVAAAASGAGASLADFDPQRRPSAPLAPRSLTPPPRPTAAGRRGR